MTTTSSGVRCMLMRGGTSKGAFFVEDDLPAEPAARNDLLLRVMGSPDPRQIDGVGGAHPLTTKVAIVAPSARDGIDVEYLFLQVGVDDATVTDRQNCGNMLAAVGPFAVERGLIDVEDGTPSLRILMRNTNNVAVATFPVAGGRPVYEGDTEISGVPGTAAAVSLEFEDIARHGGSVLPTGRAVEIIGGLAVTLVDSGMPVVVIRAADVGITGYESCERLTTNTQLRARLEAIRLVAGPLMGLGDVADTTVPKLTIVAPPKGGAAVSTRTFIPHRCHDAIGVLGAISVAAACQIAGSVAERIAALDPESPIVRLEHPTGTFDAIVSMASDPPPRITRAGIIRTARLLMDGTIYPRSY